MMFIGRYNHMLDAKSRLAIPAKLREAIPYEGDRSVFYICRGHSGCLFMYTEREFDAMVNAWNAAAAAAPFETALKRERLLFSSAQKVSVDSQGRILMPADLQKMSGITKDVVIIGIRNRIEIWDQKRWEEYETSESESYDQADNEIAKYLTGKSRSESDVNS